MKKAFLGLLLALSSSAAMANPGGSVEVLQGRLKIQFSVQKEKSRGSLELRKLLLDSGFENDDGFVRTRDTMAPLEMYNYLYDHGRFVFTIFLPVNDSKLFVSFEEKGFIAFEGIAAQKLFDLVKQHVPRNDLTHLEQYKFTDSSYCDRTVAAPVQYRCWIEK